MKSRGIRLENGNCPVYVIEIVAICVADKVSDCDRVIRIVSSVIVHKGDVDAKVLHINIIVEVVCVCGVQVHCMDCKFPCPVLVKIMRKRVIAVSGIGKIPKRSCAVWLCEKHRDIGIWICRVCWQVENYCGERLDAGCRHASFCKKRGSD